MNLNKKEATHTERQLSSRLHRLTHCELIFLGAGLQMLARCSTESVFAQFQRESSFPGRQILVPGLEKLC